MLSPLRRCCVKTLLLVWIVGGVVVGGRTLCRADIAPPRNLASGIVGRGGSPIRMEKADVRIVWGFPSALTATFTMLNPTQDPIAMPIGFPMPKVSFFGASKT